ncbi:MAG: YCF48-related protein [Thermodesulfobacteriota bacterium]|nr:YCF48-related protein [Thermodesulfobacteriota bacterium]
MSLIIKGITFFFISIFLCIPDVLSSEGNVSIIEDDLYDVKVVEDKYIWAAGYYGTIIYSEDGGGNWVVQKSGTKEPLFGISGVDPTHLWIVGAYGTILHTRDGGKNWEKQKASTKNHLFAVQFLDEKEGWALGNYSTILHTKDGGITWEDQSLGKDLQLYGICFIDSYNGWTAGEFGVIYHTENGGKDWKKQESGIEVDLAAESVQSLFNIYFKDSNQGWAGGLDGIILKTSDGGKTWVCDKGTGTKEHLLGIHAADEMIWAVGLRGTLISKRGEDRWFSINLELKRHLNAIDMGKKVGVIVGCNGSILLTEDKGLNWELLLHR